MSRTVSVCASIEYSYLVTLDDDFDVTNIESLCIETDMKDPCFNGLMKVLHDKAVNWSAETASIVDDDTGEVLY